MHPFYFKWNLNEVDMFIFMEVLIFQSRWNIYVPLIIERLNNLFKNCKTTKFIFLYAKKIGNPKFKKVNYILHGILNIFLMFQQNMKIQFSIQFIINFFLYSPKRIEFRKFHKT